MGWTKWRKLAKGKEWFNDEFDHEGPCVYELALGGPRGGDMEEMYVGETKNEAKRMQAYASHGSHNRKVISSALREGWTLYYRAIACKSKAEAKRKQDSLLAKFDYPWNIVGQSGDDD